MLGKSRLISVYQQVKNEAASKQGFRDRSSTKTSFVMSDGDYSSIPDNQAMVKMQNDLNHMRQELNFLKKILSSNPEEKK